MYRATTRKCFCWANIGKEIQTFTKEFGWINFTFGFIFKVIGRHRPQDQPISALDRIKQPRMDRCSVFDQTFMAGDIMV